MDSYGATGEQANDDHDLLDQNYDQEGVPEIDAEFAGDDMLLDTDSAPESLTRQLL